MAWTITASDVLSARPGVYVEMKMLGQPELQQHTLRLYGELMLVQHDWSRKLVVAVGEACAAGGLPAACSMAGAASLSIEPDVAQAKAVLRDGGIDFLVGTVDEALRTLKNEIRKGRPLAVALACDAATAAAELLDRGVQPDLLFTTSWSKVLLAEDGWHDVPRLFPSAVNTPGSGLKRYLSERGLETCLWPLPGRAAVRAFDADMLAILPEDDVVRRRWTHGIARYQRSAGQDFRAAWVTEEERERLSMTLKARAL